MAGRLRYLVDGYYVPHALIAELKEEVALEQKASTVSSGGASSDGELEEMMLMSHKRHRRSLKSKARLRFSRH